MAQVVGILIQGANSVFSCPLVSEIHEGVIFSNRDKRTLHTKLLYLLNDLVSTAVQSTGFYIVADAYYANQSVIKGMQKGIDLISRARHNTVAHLPLCENPEEPRRRGRPKKYGERIKLFDEFTSQTMSRLELKVPDGRIIELWFCHKESEKYRERVRKKIRAYQMYAQVAIISQGLCQFLSCKKPREIHNQCRLYFRTLDREKSPSEKITAKALENCNIQFLQSKNLPPGYAKFLQSKLNPANIAHEELLAV